MDSLDSDPPLVQDRPQRPARPRRPRQRPPARQQIVARRAIAVGFGLLILILIVLGIRGCLNARKERALENYGRDVASIMDQSTQDGKAFFGLLDDPQSLSPIEYGNEIGGIRGSADSLVTRAENLDAPDEMSSAQRSLVLTLQLRQAALAGVADRVQTALGTEGRERAIGGIANQMEGLLASDVVYRQLAKPAIEGVLEEEGIEGVSIPESEFLPDLDWLGTTQIDSALSRVTGTSTAATGGVHGLGLISTAANGITLEAGVPVTIDAGGAPVLDVTVQNQGESDETGVTVQVQVNGDQPIEETIDTIAPGETQIVQIPISPAPSGEVSLSVEVLPVPSEQVSSNNRATYTVTFQ